MDVFKDNFEEVKKEVEQQLAGDVEFVSIDFEMTGISLTDRTMRTGYADTPQERYAKMRPIAIKYSIVQLGVCLFTKGKKGKDGKYALVARPYNFYAFPEQGEDVVLSLGAISFLREQGMDFGAWLTKGISFIDAKAEEVLLKRMEEERQKEKEKANGSTVDSGRIVVTRAGDREFVKEQMDALDAWYAGKGLPEAEEGESAEDAKFRERRHKEITLTRCNAFLRRALFEQIQVKYPDLVTESRNGQVIAFKMTQKEKDERAALREQERQAKFSTTLGLRQIFKAICAAKCPVIVHNGMFDLMFMMRSFHGQLPATLGAFKEEFKQCLTCIYDTKYIASREDLLHMSLGETHVEGLYHSLVMEPKWGKVVLAKGFEKYAAAGSEESKSFAHEGGYDAYLTGCIFARMRDILEQQGQKEEAVINRVYQYRSLFESDLAGEDTSWPKGHVFHLGIAATEKKVTTEDLMKMFGEANSIHTVILWVDDTQAFAIVNATEITEAELLKEMISLKGITLTKFSTWLTKKEGSSSASATASRLCDEPNTLAWIFKRTLNLLGWGEKEGGDEKRMKRS